MKISVKKWTEEEENYLRDNVGKITFKEIAANINRPLSAIVYKASQLNLKAKRPWTEEEDRYIVENAYSKSYIEIALDLKRSYNAVSSRANILNISVHRKWTKTDIEYLEKKFGRISNAKIATSLKRTVDAIVVKARRLGLGAKRDAEGMVVLASLHRALYPRDTNGSHKLSKYIKNGLLVHEFYLSSKNPKKKTTLVNIDDFWKWAEQHKELVKFAELEENSLGREPKWVKEKRKQEWLDYSNKRWAGKV